MAVGQGRGQRTPRRATSQHDHLPQSTTGPIPRTLGEHRPRRAPPRPLDRGGLAPGARQGKRTQRGKRGGIVQHLTRPRLHRLEHPLRPVATPCEHRTLRPVLRFTTYNVPAGFPLARPREKDAGESTGSACGSHAVLERLKSMGWAEASASGRVVRPLRGCPRARDRATTCRGRTGPGDDACSHARRGRDGRT